VLFFLFFILSYQKAASVKLFQNLRRTFSQGIGKEYIYKFLSIKFSTKLQLRVWEVFTNLEESKFNFFTLSVEANLAEAKTVPSLSYVEQFFKQIPEEKNKESAKFQLF
jgi:hypothetical protein